MNHEHRAGADLGYCMACIAEKNPRFHVRVWWHVRGVTLPPYGAPLFRTDANGFEVSGDDLVDAFAYALGFRKRVAL